MSKPHRIPDWLNWLAAWALCACAPYLAAEDAAAPTAFQAPTGFNGLRWGEGLSALGAVKLARANTVTDSKGKATQLRCTENPGGCAGWSPSDQDVEGRGSFAVAEYYRETDRNPWAAALVALHGATYLFCDEWQGSTVPTRVKQQLRFCGARVFYRSETAAQLAGKSAASPSNHERLLRHLIGEYGPPDGHRIRSGVVTVGPVQEGGQDAPDATPEPAPRDEAATGILRYRWCGLLASSAALVPACAATITLMFNPDTGWGMVLFATDVVYKFAQARHAVHDENNELYMALVSRDPGKPTNRNANECLRTTGSLVCTGKLVTLSDRERQRFEP